MYKMLWDFLAAGIGIYCGFKIFLLSGQNIPGFGYVPIGIIAGILVAGAVGYAIHAIESVISYLIWRVFKIQMYNEQNLQFKKRNSNNLDRKKVMANFYVLQKRTFELAESYSRFDEEQESLLKHATESIKKFDFDRRPSGFTLEFIASYPDVVSWFMELSDKEIEDIFVGHNQEDFFDNNGQTKQEYLRIMIDAYKSTGAELECAA